MKPGDFVVFEVDRIGGDIKCGEYYGCSNGALVMYKSDWKTSTPILRRLEPHEYKIERLKDRYVACESYGILDTFKAENIIFNNPEQRDICLAALNAAENAKRLKG